jgi:hypothetical protein
MAMRGRGVLMESFVAHCVRHIFGNPGTTETPLLDSLPAFPQIDYIMALHEGVAVGAASFTRRPQAGPLSPTSMSRPDSAMPSARSTARSRPIRRWW